MDNWRYMDHIELLRNRQVRPTFETIKTLVSTHSREPLKSGAGLKPALIAAALICTMAGASAFLLSAGPRSDAPTPVRLEHAPSITKQSDFRPLVNCSLPDCQLKSNPTGSQQLQRSPAGSPEPIGRRIADGLPSPPVIRGCMVRDAPITAEWATHRFSAMLVSPLASDRSGSIFLSIGAGVSSASNSPAAFRPSYSDAFVGVGYHVSLSTSITLLAGEDVFAVPAVPGANNLSFRDTSFIHGGLQYRNLLGQISSTSGPAPIRVYWLGGSIRYELGSSTLRPFVEVMAGSSWSGLISRQSLGTELIATDRLSLDVMLSGGELLQWGSGWFTKATASAAVVYGF